MSDQERDALAEVLRKHVWVRHMTHRADCDCNWKCDEPAEISAQRYNHAEHVADAVLAAGWRPPGTDTSDTVRACARCGERPILGNPEDLTCCDRCASQVGYEAALWDAQDAIAAIQPPNHHTRAWWGLKAAGVAVNALRDRRAPHTGRTP